MNRILQVVAIALWITSFFLPTLPLKDGGYRLGFQVAQGSTMAALLIPFSLLYPLHISALASNLVFIREIGCVLIPGRKRVKLPSHTLLGLALLVNIYVGLYTFTKSDAWPSPIQGVLQLPGFYTWCVAFFVLLFARSLGEPANPSLQPTASSRG